MKHLERRFPLIKRFVFQGLHPMFIAIFWIREKKREGLKMSVNFFPDREQMLKEIEGCVVSSKLDVLLGLCTCCLYKSYDEGPLVSQCLKCSVQKGIMRISNKMKLADARDLEFLRVY